MSGGILGGGLPQGSGILGGFEQYARDNQAGLLGLAAGLMSGDMSAGLQGYAQGAAQDERTRLIRQKQAEDEQRKVAARQLAQQMKLPDVLANDPDQVFAIARQKYTPKELSFTERQFNQLTPEQQAAYRQREFLGGGESNIGAQVEQRKQAASQIGLTPEHPAYQSYILTGKMPREDQAPLTATDKKAILEADDQVLMGKNALESLDRASALSDRAYEGFGAGVRGSITGAFGSDAGEATIELDNEVKNNALQSMKSIFGANPTEGERAILLEIQGSSSMPAPVRKRIYEKAKLLVQRRLELNQQRAEGIRGGTYYGNQGRQGQQQQAPQPSAQGAIQVDGYTIRQR